MLTFEVLQGAANLRLVRIREVIHVFGLVLEIVLAPDKRALDLGRPPLGHGVRESASCQPYLGAALERLFVYVVADVGIRLWLRYLGGGFGGLQAFDVEARAEALRVVFCRLCQCFRELAR